MIQLMFIVVLLSTLNQQMQSSRLFGGSLGFIGSLLILRNSLKVRLNSTGLFSKTFLCVVRWILVSFTLCYWSAGSVLRFSPLMLSLSSFVLLSLVLLVSLFAAVCLASLRFCTLWQIG